MQKLVKLWGRKFSEAWSACMLCMVQGDLSVVNLHHAMTASKTGLVAATAYSLAMLVGQSENKWLAAWLTGLLVTAADLLNHPTHYGPAWAEALLTGGVATVICVVWEKIRKT